MSGKIIHPTAETFEAEVVKSDIPVLVDFYADWCGPCQRVAPVLEELAAEYDGRVKVAKINVDDNQKLAMDFGIMSIPTMLFVKGGQVADTIIGGVPKEIIASKISAML